MDGEHLDPNQLLDLMAGKASAEQRARLEAHVDRCSECMQLMIDLGRAATQPLTRTLPLDEEGSPYSVGAPSRAHGAELSPGDAVDHYEVERLLGRGGMGEVYRARDVKLGRRVALKLIHPLLMSSEEAKQRFENEARATAKLSHPNIVTIHGVGEHRGRPYVALEYIEGQNLRERLLTDPPDLAQALGMGLAIARAVAAAHAQGVIHRDLKPENVIVDRAERVRVVDFGLAKIGGVSEDGVPTSGKPTAATSFGGTPLYMAPEQWRLERAGAPADVWALGVIVYELSAHRHPFTDPGMTDAERGAIERLRARVTEAPPPLPHDLANVPAELGELILGCLAQDPQRRPPATEVAEKLASLLDRQTKEPPAEARPIVVAPAPSSLSKHRRRSRWASVIAIASVLTAIAAVIQVVRLSRRAIETREPAAVTRATVAAPTAARETPSSPPASGVPPPPTASVVRRARPTSAPPATLPRVEPKPPRDELCSDTPDCRNSGLCRERDGACVASSDADCRRSLNCVSFGNCALKDGRCLPSEPDHCRNASRCASWGMCSLVGSRCSALDPSDCRASSECKAKGLCTAAGGWCVVGSSADCEQSALCKTQGRCRRDAAKNRCVE